MHRHRYLHTALGLIMVLASLSFLAKDERIASRIVDPKKEVIELHWKGAGGRIFGNLGELRSELAAQGREMVMGMNGGMFTTDHGPVGLYIEDGRMLHRIDRRTAGSDNFHMQPNGVFGIREDGSAFVMTTADMKDMLGVRYATQSGPMLIADGTINAHFTPGSKNLNIRNGVGVRADGQVVFAISREPVNFHDFATWFQEQGCTNALYLDGAVSKAYIPEAGMLDLDGRLGVLIAVSRPE